VHRPTVAWSLGSRVRIQLRLWMLVSFVLCRQWPLWEADHSFRGVQRPDVGSCLLKRLFHVKQDLNLCTADRLTKKNSSCNEIDLILFFKKKKKDIQYYRWELLMASLQHFTSENMKVFFFLLSWTWTEKYYSSRPQDILRWWNMDCSCAAQ